MHSNYDESPDTKNIQTLLKKVHESEYVIPYFQRGFEWQPGMVSDLIESVVQGYYAGLILLWELNENEAKNEEWDPVWGANLKNSPKYAILDGQQRLASLYYAFYNPEKNFPNRKTYYTFYIDLIKTLNENYDDIINYKYSFNYTSWENLKMDKDEWIEKGNIPLSVLSASDPKNKHEKFINSKEFSEWSEKFIEKNKNVLPDNLSIYSIRDIFSSMEGYKFVTYSLSKKRNLHDICNIFARVNKKGMNLSTFDLLNAFLFPKGIKLRKDLWENLENNKLKKIDSNMKEYLLKTISLYKQNYCSSKYLYNLVPGEKIIKKNKNGKRESKILVENGEEFKLLWNKSCKYSEKARKIIMNVGNRDFGAIKADFIPNTTLIPVLAAILWDYDGNVIDKEFRNIMKLWYWSAVFTGDYSGSSDSIMSKDYRDWLGWMNNGSEIYRIKKLTEQAIDEIDFKDVNKGSAIYNAVISLLALNNAGDFFEGTIVGTGDYSNKKINDHHIFPKRLKKIPNDNRKLFDKCKDSIVNRTLLLDSTNQKISNKKPSVYIDTMVKIWGSEEEVKRELKKHFINGKAFKYLINDNFDDFIVERERLIKEKVSSILNL